MAPTKQRSVIPLMLRLPADLHRTLAREAEKNLRSLNSEIIVRLGWPFNQKKLIQSIAQQTATSTIDMALEKGLLGTNRGEQSDKEDKS